eukprot:Tbor_TRINITY_DN3362_c0_g1::TRINITY_DN3362_c0_g1_i1::g.23454::m.23454
MLFIPRRALHAHNQSSSLLLVEIPLSQLRYSSRKSLVNRILSSSAVSLYSSTHSLVTTSHRTYSITPSRLSISATSSESHSTSPTTTESQEESSTDHDITVDWSSQDMYVRLGFTDRTIHRKLTKDEIRKRFKLLAKKYHPDLNHGSGTDAAFKNIKEAHEILTDDNKRSAYDQFGHQKYQEYSSQGFGFTHEEYAQRMAMRQLFSDGLPFFISGCFIFVTVVIYHYRQRILPFTKADTKSRTGRSFTDDGVKGFGSSFLVSGMHFLAILITMGMFPRLLAAGIIFVMHCNDKMAVYEKELQSNAHLSLIAYPNTSPASRDALKKMGSKDAPKHVMDINLKAGGIDESHLPYSNMVVEVTKVPSNTVKSAQQKESDKRVTTPCESAPIEKETLVFEKGVTSVTFPLPFRVLPGVLGNDSSKSTSPESSQYHIRVRFMNDDSKVTLYDKEAYI